MTAPAAMPSVEEIKDLLLRFHADTASAWRHERDGIATSAARAVFDLFAPILAEKERLAEALHYANGVAELAIKHRDAAEAALAAERGRIADGLQAQADALWERCETKRTDPPSTDEQADAAQAFALQKAAAAIRAQGE